MEVEQRDPVSRRLVDPVTQGDHAGAGGPGRARAEALRAPRRQRGHEDGGDDEDLMRTAHDDDKATTDADRCCGVVRHRRTEGGGTLDTHRFTV